MKQLLNRLSETQILHFIQATKTDCNEIPPRPFFFKAKLNFSNSLIYVENNTRVNPSNKLEYRTAKHALLNCSNY